MATWSVFTDQIPESPNNNDGTPAITVANAIRVNADGGAITHIRFYATTTVGGTYTGILWKLSAPDAGVKQVIGPSGAVFRDYPGTPDAGSWNVIQLEEAIPASDGDIFLVAYRNSQGRYVATPGLFSNSPVNTAGLINGPLEALGVNQEISEWSNQNVPNNRFYIGTDTPEDMGIPSGYFNGSNYFVDVVFDDSPASTTPWSKDLAVEWRVLGSWQRDLELRARVLGAWQKDVSALWRVLGLWQKDLGLSWRVLGAWHRDLEVQWAVVVGSWTKDLEVRWVVLGVWTKDLVLLSRVLSDSTLPLSADAVAYLDTEFVADLRVVHIISTPGPPLRP